MSYTRKAAGHYTAETETHTVVVAQDKSVKNGDWTATVTAKRGMFGQLPRVESHTFGSAAGAKSWAAIIAGVGASYD